MRRAVAGDDYAPFVEIKVTPKSNTSAYGWVWHANILYTRVGLGEGVYMYGYKLLGSAQHVIASWPDGSA